MKSAKEIKRLLLNNPLFWVDKSCALTQAMYDGTIPPDDMNRAAVEAERNEADRKVAEFVAAGKILQEEVNAERKQQMENA